ncbi:hypothetical protein CVT25_003321 [Psilocybe cyanescens]|uniref:SH3 domain-containing protein n=1 Tax=Psilocybe cyanescens TaxID=93625 RepID=A0A409WMM7_PSICY|nr:hypothetical protein CVT25_003321 [Psilocybe cyanescens]
MQAAHKRAADSFISLHANLDLPISVGLDVNLAPLASLVGIGNGGGGSPATTTSVHTTPIGQTGTTLDTTPTTVAAQPSEGSHTVAMPTTSNGDDGSHTGAVTPTIVLTSIERPSSIPGTTGNDVSFTSAADTSLRSIQGSTANGAGAGILVAIETLSGSVIRTITRVPRPTVGAAISFGASSSLVENHSIDPSNSADFLTTATTTFASVDPTNDGPGATNTPRSGSSKRGLSPGEIAGIVIALIILLIGIFIVICRRRRAYRRDQATLGWSTSRLSYQYQDESSPRFQDVFRRFTMPSAPNRPNSFNEETAILSPPPMAEYARSERSSMSVSSLPRSFSSSLRDRGHRHSGSVGSTNSAGTVQSLLIDTREFTVKETAPMSAPPFSSSKSFVPSSPPIPTIQISPPTSPKKIFIPSYRPIAVDLPPIPPLPSSPPPMPPSSPLRTRNPFEDPPGHLTSSRQGNRATMRVSQRQTSDHIVIGRALADKTIVEAREPQLIKIGLPLPSVPVLTPLLSPLVGGSNSNQNPGSGSGSTTTAAAPPPAQSTTSSGNSGSSGGASGGSSGGSSSGSTGDGSTTSNPGNGGSSGGGTSSGGTSSSGGSSSGGTSSSGGSSSGDTPASGGSTSSGGSSGSGNGSSSSGDTSSSGSTSGDTSTTGNGSSSGSSSSSSQGGDGNTSTSGGIVLSSGGSANGTSTSDGGSSDSNGSDSGDVQHSAGSGGGSSSGGVANAGGIPGSTGGVHSVSGKGIPYSTQSGGSSAATGVGGISSGGSDGESSGGKHGLSGGAIAGIAICLLALLVGFVIFFVRRRTRSRRHEQTNRWWFTSNRVSQPYGDRNSKEILAPGVRTARSSFATTVDHSDRSDRNHSPIPRNSFIIPPLPPMAEIGRSNGNIPALTIDTSHFSSAPVIIESRFSVSSQVSAETGSEYLVVHHRDSLNPGTPMSVRPFSPSESFAFPRPPDPVGDRNSAYSRPSSSGTLAMLQAGTHFSFHSSNVPPTPSLPTLIVSQDNPINSVLDPFADNNPFDNPAPTEPSYASGNGDFAETEFICRPFVPTLPDELAVRPDDPVRILKTFDDGWALVEKVRPDDPKGKRTNEGVERGLIPIDCLRAPGQALPAFFAAKRVSSYAGSLAGSEINAL